MIRGEQSGKPTLHVSIDNPGKTTKVDTISLLLGHSMMDDIHNIVMQSMEDGSVEVLIVVKDGHEIGNLG